VYTLVTAAAPAGAGDAIIIYGTGGGELTPRGQDGLPPVNVQNTQLPVTVTVGGQTVNAAYAGISPGLISGVLQINAIVPDGVAAGPQPIVVKVGDFSSQEQLTIQMK